MLINMLAERPGLCGISCSSGSISSRPRGAQRLEESKKVAMTGKGPKGENKENGTEVKGRRERRQGSRKAN
eukprot:307955-Chlamydomonas_euryale.AAC.5